MFHHHLSAATATLLLLLLLLLPPFASPLNQEGLFLQEFKGGLDSSSSPLSDWNLRDTSPCNWTGVTCSAAGVVTALDLPSLGLNGPFHPLLCRLPRLSRLSLRDNYINSTLPSDAILPCANLAHLDLSTNLLVGPIPSSLPSLPLLLHLDLSSNNFSGPIPTSFARFPRLQNLSLAGNLLTGTAVPAFLAGVSSLRRLDLAYNPFSPSPIPPELGNLAALENLWLSDCRLVGEIPASLGGFHRLRNLDLSNNALVGTIPSDLGNLSSVVQIELYNNSLSGEIPPGFFANLSFLRQIDASMNRLEGVIPPEAFDLPLLEGFHFYENQLSGGIPARLAGAKMLSDLRLFKNRLTGSLPADFGRNSPISFIDVSDNLLSGGIPNGICDRGFLSELLLLDNSFSGHLPEGLGRCRTLSRVRLRNNHFSGDLPVGMWGLPHLYLLDLAGNSFSGEISSAIAGGTNISGLIISDNQFTGDIPAEIGALANLNEFSAGNNRLTGPLPVELGKLDNLGKLDLHNNSLSGKLSGGIFKFGKKLSEINLADNDFSGGIPPQLGDLPALNYLDLSGNFLTGKIPNELQNLKLNMFNLSNNQLAGDIPPAYANEVYKDSFLGNPGLCGDIVGLCAVSPEAARKNHGYLWMLRSIFIFASLVLVVGVAWFYWRYRSYKKAKSSIDKSKWMLTSFHKLGFSEYEILDCLDEDNVIGSGASGKVYKAVLSNGEAVAVKKLWGKNVGGEQVQNPNADEAFEAEVATLGKIRHKNIVKLWCCCSHKECKLLVYEYMPNGSLGDLLHGSKAGILDWPTRYKIALDAAEGLSYLHHDCVPPIVHRDVKSNNILLDAEFGARVADFGVAKALEAIGMKNKSMSVVAGSCGYIAPEYAYTLRVNEKSDIYSFGVVLLELVTGKLPVDPEFGEKDLVKWVCSTLDQKGMDLVLDPKLDLCFKEEVCKVLNIALQCTSALPINRPSMRRVVKMLLDVGAAENNKSKSERKDGKLSPYYYEDASDHSSAV